ncbi:MAG: sensor histidine kinase [Bacteroidia bacterium]
METKIIKQPEALKNAIMTDIRVKGNAHDLMIKLNEFLENKVRERTIELTQALEREKENNDLKSRFVTMASHEFRTPLAVVLSSLALIEQHTKCYNNEKLAKYFNRITLSVENLREILDEFLSLEKIENGKAEIVNCIFNFQEVVRDTIEEMKLRLKKGQRISYTHKGEEEVFQDKKILHNTLLNLISNAIKYSDEDKEIDLSSEINDRIATITVKDQGRGIPENEQKNIFTLFFRAKNAEPIQGTGVGLNIVKKYMSLAGGTITFSSKENEGSVFTLIFPKNAESRLD